MKTPPLWSNIRNGRCFQHNERNWNPAKGTGFTLLEIMISSAIFATILTVIYSMLITGKDTHDLGAFTAELEAQARRVVERIAEEVAPSGVLTLNPNPQPPFGSSSLTFQKCTGYDLATYSVLWGPQIRIEVQPDPTDPNDGLDNNGNGLIDEGIVVLRLNPGTPQEVAITLTSWVREYLEGETPNGMDDNGNGLVDERGLSFDLNGEVLTIRLTLERRDPKNQLITRTITTSVKLRN